VAGPSLPRRVSLTLFLEAAARRVRCKGRTRTYNPHQRENISTYLLKGFVMRHWKMRVLGNAGKGPTCRGQHQGLTVTTAVHIRARLLFSKSSLKNPERYRELICHLNTSLEV
jgi:hypothetical protein